MAGVVGVKQRKARRGSGKEGKGVGATERRSAGNGDRENKTGKYLQTIIDVQTRHHHQKPIRVHTPHQRRDHKAVPALMAVIQQAIHRIRPQQRYRNHIQIPERDLVVLLRLLLRLTQLMLILKGDSVREPRIRRRVSDTHVDGLGDLPGFDEDAHALAEEDHPGGAVAVVEEVEEDDGLHEDVGEDGADGDADVVFFVAPVGLG